MGQPNKVFGSDYSVDLTTSGPEATPEYGRGASFLNPGKARFQRSEVEKIFQANFDEAERYRLTFEPDWIANYQQYHGETEDSGKAEWQSQVHVPISAQAVNVAASRITNVIFGEDEWFDTRAGSRNRDDLDELAKKLVLWQFDKSRGQDPINQSVKDAMICGNGPLKVHVANEIEYGVDTVWKKNPTGKLLGQPVDAGGAWKFVDKTRSVKRLRFESIMPTDFWLDPTGMNRWCIQRIKRSLSDVWAMARDQKAEDGKTILRKSVYDPDVVAMVTAGSRDQRLDNQAAIIRHERIHSIGEKTVDVYEFWGDLIDPTNGVTLYRNIVATFINKQYCVRMPERNPLLHRAPPFIFFRAQLLPHQIYGYGLLGQTVKLQAEIDRAIQYVADKMHLSVPMAEIDASAARNPERWQGDHIRIVPGGIIQRKGAIDPQRRVITPVSFCEPINQWEVEFVNFLMRSFQMVTPNEFATGQRLTTERKTKEEVQSQTGAAQQQFNDSAQYIEQTALSPMVNMVYQLMLQFEENYDDPEMLALVADSPAQQQMLFALKGQTPEERWRTMMMDTDFKVNGVTNDITRQQNLQNIQQFMQIIGNDQTLAMLIDKSELLRDVLHDLQLKKNFVLAPAMQILQAQGEAAIRQMQNPQQPPQGAPAQGAEGQPGAPGQQIAGQNAHNSRQQLGAQAQHAQTAPLH
jgi:hypothetical protein